MARERPRLSAKKWAETADAGGYTPTVVKLPDGVQFFTPKKAGAYRLEIVPYVVPDNAAGGPNPHAQSGELHYERTFFTHKNVGADERAYVCLAKTLGKPCPICEHRRELMRDKGADEALIKELAPKHRQLWNIYDHEDAEKGVQIWEISYHLFGRQLKTEVNNSDEDEGFEYFADPEDGLTLRVGMEEKTMGAGKPFLECNSIKFKKRPKPLSKEILDAAQPLDDLLIVLPYEKLKSIFLQEEDAGVDVVDAQDDDDFKSPGESESAFEAKDAPTKKELKVKATADELGISKGDDVTWKGTNWTVLKVTDDGTTLTLMDDDDTMKKGVPVEDVRKPGKAAEKEAAPAKGKAELLDKEPWADEDEPPAKGKKADTATKAAKELVGKTTTKAAKDDDWDADWDD